MTRIYVASSWRNPWQPGIVRRLRSLFDVYDFREDGFGWHEIDPAWQSWSHQTYRLALASPDGGSGFRS